MQQIDDVPLMACKKIIKADDITSRLYQPAAQVGAQETGAPGDQNTDSSPQFQSVI